jgi:hypothetical protein
MHQNIKVANRTKPHHMMDDHSCEITHSTAGQEARNTWTIKSASA